MIKFTHLLVFVAIAVASSSSSAAADSAAPAKSTNLRLLQNQNAFRETQESEESVEEPIVVEESNTEAESDSDSNSNKNNRQRNGNRNRNKNTGEEETTLVYNEYPTAPNVFKFQTDVTVLFTSFQTKTTAEYGFALMFTAILAFSLETLVACRRDDWVGLRVDDEAKAKSYLCSALILTMLHMLSATIALMLILIISSFNGGIFVSAVIGSGIGHMVYTARRLKRDAKKVLKEKSADDDIEKGTKRPASALSTPLATIPENGFSNEVRSDSSRRTSRTQPDDFTQSNSTIASRSYSQRKRTHPHYSARSRASHYSRSASLRSSASGRIRTVEERIPSVVSVASDESSKRIRQQSPPNVPVATPVVGQPPLVRSNSGEFSVDSSAIVVDDGLSEC